MNWLKIDSHLSYFVCQAPPPLRPGIEITKDNGKRKVFRSNIIKSRLKSIWNYTNSWDDWLGERQTTGTIANLKLHSMSNTKHSVMGVIFNILIGRHSLK